MGQPSAPTIYQQPSQSEQDAEQLAKQQKAAALQKINQGIFAESKGLRGMGGLYEWAGPTPDLAPNMTASNRAKTTTTTSGSGTYPGGKGTVLNPQPGAPSWAGPAPDINKTTPLANAAGITVTPVQQAAGVKPSLGGNIVGGPGALPPGSGLPAWAAPPANISATKIPALEQSLYNTAKTVNPNLTLAGYQQQQATQTLKSVQAKQYKASLWMAGR